MERIGEYLVHRLLGEGGMGKVYEAEERLSKRRVALKVLRPELARSEDGRRLFLNETRILAQLEPVECPRGWMSPDGYRRYLRVTLAKMREREAAHGKRGRARPRKR